MGTSQTVPELAQDKLWSLIRPCMITKSTKRHPNIMCIYTDNGYANRKDYLNALREDYGDLVNILTSVLPASEDFDGLVTSLEDAMDSGEYDDLM